MLKAIIMDFDGLIVDTELLWYQLYKDWLQEEHGYELSKKEFLVCVGADSSYLFKKLESEVGIKVNRKQVESELSSVFIEKSKDLPIKDGVPELISQIKKEGLLLALATSATKKKPEYHLKRFDLFDHFDCIVTSEDVNNIKPAPDLFKKALLKCGVEKHEAVVIEDSLNGEIASNLAGIKVIICPNEITKYSNFSNYYQKVDAVSEIDLERIKSDFA